MEDMLIADGLVTGYSYAELITILNSKSESDWVRNHGFWRDQGEARGARVISDPAHDYPQDEYYGNYNTEHYSLYDVAAPTIEEFANKTFSEWTVAILEQRPGMVIPRHRDTYYNFKKAHGMQNKEVIRYNIFLDDWHPGHYMEADSKPIVNWKAGNYIRLHNSRWHRTGNIGSVYKYTCQLTGYERD